MFLSLDRLRTLAVYGIYQKYLICVLKMNEGITGLEQGWVINYIIFIFGWTIILNENVFKFIYFKYN